MARTYELPSSRACRSAHRTRSSGIRRTTTRALSGGLRAWSWSESASAFDAPWGTSRCTRRRAARRSASSSRAPVAERLAGLVERGGAERVAGRAVAELLARVLAVALADDVAQVGLVLERVGVLLRVAAAAQILRRRLEHRDRL